jgi:hypothetical protein
VSEYCVSQGRGRWWKKPAWQVHFITIEGSIVFCECRNKHDAERIAAALNERGCAGVSEEAIEVAYWVFDARKRGTADWKQRPQSERDAFKWAVRSMQRLRGAM